MFIREIKMAKFPLLVVLCAVLAGIVFLLPHILMPVFRGDALYSPLVVKDVNTYTVDQTFLYAPGMKDVADGYLLVSDPSIYENKGKLSFLSPALPSLVLGIVSYVIGLEMVFILSSFVFPFIIFMISYFLFHRLTKSVHASITASFLLIFGFNFIATLPSTPQVIEFYFSRLIGHPIEPINYLARLPQIQFTFAMFMASFVFLYIAMEKKTAKYFMIYGISLGFLFYSYFYYWTSMSAAAGILFIMSILKKDYKTAKNLILSTAAAFLVAAPYVIGMLFVIKSAWYSDISSRLGIESIFAWQQLAKYIIFYAIFAVISRKNTFFWIMTSMLISGIALLNIQLLTGFSLQGRHYDTVFLAPLTVIALSYAAYEVACRIPGKARYIKIASVVIVSALIIVSIYSHSAYAANASKNFYLDRDYRDLYKWLNENTEKDSVVLTASVEQNSLITVHTHNNVFIPNGFSSPSTDEEILDRLFIAYKAFNITPEYLSEMMDNEDGAMAYNAMRERLGTSDGALFESVYWNLYTFHEKFANEHVVQKELLGEVDKDKIYAAMLEYYRNFTPDLGKYRIDYILVSGYEKSVANFTLPERFSLVWSNRKFSLYSL